MLQKYTFFGVETRLRRCLALNFDLSLPSLLTSSSSIWVYPATRVKCSVVRTKNDALSPTRENQRVLL